MQHLHHLLIICPDAMLGNFLAEGGDFRLLFGGGRLKIIGYFNGSYIFMFQCDLDMTWRMWPCRLYTKSRLAPTRTTILEVSPWPLVKLVCLLQTLIH
jgi:hypothetical protein